MARKKNLLPYVFIEGPDPDFPLDDDAVSRISGYLGKPIGAGAAAELKMTCQRLIASRRAEMLWRGYDEVEIALAPLSKASTSLFTWAVEFSRVSEVGNILESILDGEMEKPNALFPLHASKDELVCLVPGASDWASIPAGNMGEAYAVRLSTDALQRFAATLATVVRLAEREIRQRKVAVAAPAISAHDVFLIQVCSWAKKFDYRYSEYVDGRTPSPLSHVASLLLNLLPSDLWDNRDTSPGAVAMQIKRAKKEHRKRNTAGQKLAREQS